ncbi:DinI-like family protein [Escherichia coli]|nr:DinI-like family protein [Escherichia coli]
MTAWTVTSEKRHLHRILNRLWETADDWFFH